MDQDNKTQNAIEKLSSKELGNVKILMIEDDSFFSELVLGELSKEGCIPYSADDGGDAVKLAEQFQPNLILLDLMLPSKQGEIILKELKQHDELKNIPVVIFSNKSEQSDIKQNIDDGAAAFLIKSSTQLSSLVGVVKDILKKSM